MPSFPGDLSLSIQVKSFKSSHSVIAPSHLKVWFSLSLGTDTLSTTVAYMWHVSIIFLIHFINMWISQVSSYNWQISHVSSHSWRISNVSSHNWWISHAGSHNWQISHVSSHNWRISNVSSHNWRTVAANIRISPVRSSNVQISSVRSSDLRISPVMTPNMQISPVITANMRNSPVMTANMQNSLFVKDDRYMSHIGLPSQENYVYILPICIIFLLKEFHRSFIAHHLFVENRLVLFCLL